MPEGTPPDELVAEDLIEGSGEPVRVGDLVSVHYVGVLYRNGEKFDASWDRDEPFEFVLGIGQVIPGWDRGVEGMRTGGRRQLVIPPELAYGPSGSASGSIGPDEALVFVVDLLESTATWREGEEPPGDLVVEDIVEGSGAELGAGDLATMHYVGVHQSTGEVFDASYPRGQPLQTQIGAGQVITGWDEGLVGMRVGGRRRLVIPPDKAYGEAGFGPIGPNETLVFVVDLLDVAAG